jgi:glyoxylase-like metal-dependent hydrolase (beta-lactamase superfamily II)
VTRLAIGAVMCVVVACSPVETGAQAPDTAVRSISPLRGGLYRVQDGDNATVFLVTSEGILLVDPMSPATAIWLRKEFETRFPNQPVRYVVLTSHSFRRASGGSMFDKTAERVGHERFASERVRAARTLPEPLTILDTNQDGTLQTAEFASSPWAEFIQVQNLNRDGVVTPTELYSSVAHPQRIFQRQLTIKIGGESVELHSTPTAQAADATVVVFPALRIALAAELFPVRSIPARLGPGSLVRLIASLRRVESLPVDVIVTERGEMATVADVTAFRAYLEDLNAGVRAAFANGRTLVEVQDSLVLDRHSQLADFDTGRRANIAEIYPRLRHSETSVFVAGTYVTGSADESACVPTSGCILEGTSWSGGILGVRFSVGPLAFGAQVHGNRPLTAHTPSAVFLGASAAQERDTVFAFPFVYRLGSPASRVSTTVEAGPSVVVTESGRTVFGQFGYFIESKGWNIGWLAGGVARLRLTSRTAIVVPVYLMQGGSQLLGPRISVGAGVSVGITSGVR